MLLTGGICTGSGIVGLYAAYYLPISPAAVMVLLLAVVFAVSAVFGTGRLERGRSTLTSPEVVVGTG